MNRRRFNKLTLLASLAGFSAFSFAAHPRKKMMIPVPLKAGDTIGLISPGSAATAEQEAIAIAQIQSLGFKAKRGQFLGARKGYIAGTERQRLEDLHSMFQDITVQGIWCIRGGYGCGRLLPAIDYELIKKNPKALIGYSDITALLQAIQVKTGLVGFHGPNAQPTMEPYTLEQFKSILMNSTANAIPQYKATDQEDYQAPYTITSGKASGQLLGGNLSILVSLAGTPYAIDAKNKILFIEDVGEKPYRIDRMLTQLRQTANLTKAAGIILGQFKNCEAKDLSTSLSLKDCLQDRLGDLGVPVMAGFSFGHVAHNCTLPVGALAEMDAETGMLSLLDFRN